MKNINRLTISRQDFEKSLRFLNELQGYDYGSIAYEALLLCAIIFYARPFSCNEKSKNAKAESRVDSAVTDQLTDEELKLHRRLIELRNKAIAHAEGGHHPTNVTSTGIISSQPFSIWKHFPFSSPTQIFHDLVSKVLLRANNLTASKLRNGVK